MNGVPPASDGVVGLGSLYEAKVRAELAEADGLVPGSDSAPSSGDVFAGIVAVKGLPGPAEAAGGPVLSGPDGYALAKALESLAPGGSEYFAVLSRPGPDVSADRRASRVRRVIEAVDPRIVLALDDVSAEDLPMAFGMGRLAFGRSVRACGRTLLAVDGLEASLVDAERKRRVWRQLKQFELPGSLP